MLRQYVFGFALSYANCNDAARLRDDPMFKLLLDCDSVTRQALASQPTLSCY